MPVPESEGESGTSVLTPSLPPDIAARAQRERILKAMTERCAEKTFAATTIADIVGKASISRATFYKHFANKRECFDAAADRSLAELSEAVEDAARDAGAPGPAAVRTAIAAALTRLAKQPAHARLLLVEAPSVDPEIVGRCRSFVIAALEDCLRAAEGGGGAGADPDIAFGRATVLMVEYVAADRAKQLPTLLPEILYIALLPYVGHDVAVEQAGVNR